MQADEMVEFCWIKKKIDNSGFAFTTDCDTIMNIKKMFENDCTFLKMIQCNPPFLNKYRPAFAGRY